MPGRGLGNPRDAGDRGGLAACAGRVPSANRVKYGARPCAGKMLRKACRFLGRTRPTVLGLEERRSEVKRLLHEIQGCRPRAFVRGDQQEAPAVSLSWWSPVKGKDDPIR